MYLNGVADSRGELDGYVVPGARRSIGIKRYQPRSRGAGEKDASAVTH